MKILEEMADEVQKGNSDSVEVLVERALAQDMSAEEILNGGLVEGMNTVSEKFKNNEIFIPEVLISARAMSSGLEILNPRMWPWFSRPRDRRINRKLLLKIDL